MNIVDILILAKKNHIQLWLDSGQLRYRAPQGSISPEILDQLQQHKSALIAALKSHPDNTASLFPLSYNQQSLWFLYQLAPESSSYNIAAACRILSEVNEQALQSSLEKLALRHEALRTTYDFLPEGTTACQYIHAELKPFFKTVYAEGWTDDVIREKVIACSRKPFNLMTGPVLRTHLFTHSSCDHVLLLTVHHIACDARSLSMYLDDFLKIYCAEKNGCSPDLQNNQHEYSDYIVMQYDMLAGESGRQILSYWETALAGMPDTLDLPADFSRPSLQKFQGTSLFFEVVGGLRDAIKEGAQSEGVTMTAFLLAGFQLLLMRLSGQTDFGIGVVASGRTLTEHTDVCGYCVNPVVVRSRVDRPVSRKEFFTATASSLLGALDHQEYPFPLLVEKLASRRHPGRAPLFQALFNFMTSRSLGAAAHFLCPLNEGLPDQPGPLSVLPYPIPQQEGQYDLTLEITDTGESLFCVLKYCTDLFLQTTALGMVDGYRDILKELTDTPALIIDPQQIQKDGGHPEVQAPAATEKTIAVASTFTAEPVAEALSFWMEQLDIQARINFAPYAQVFQQLLDPAGLFFKNKNGFNIIFLRLEDWQHYTDATPTAHSADRDPLGALEQNAENFMRMLSSAAARTASPFIICLCPISSIALDAAHTAFFEKMHQRLQSALALVSNVYFIAPQDLLSLYPVDGYYEELGERVGHIPFKPLFFTAMATMIARRIFTLCHAPRKVIVLDCDQTLWRGVVGEDGPLGVTIDEPFQKLQQFMTAQHDAGMLLCLCSKNTEEDVWNVFDQNPAMLLQLEHIASWRINWQPKSENIKSLAAELNLGVESFIFIDDNPIECAEAQAQCPEALILQLPEEPDHIPVFLRHVWGFDHIKVTGEDRMRTALYKENVQREQFFKAAPSYSDFIADLELTVSIVNAETQHITRIAQLTHRTNQFNFTTIRRNEGDMQNLCASSHATCLAVQVKDRFGDYGLVGVIIFTRENNALSVDTFLLSCRVLGRGVEHQMLACIGQKAITYGVSSVRISFFQTNKNHPAFDFLESAVSQYRIPCKEGYCYIVPADYAAGIRFVPSGKAAPPDAVVAEKEKKPAAGQEPGEVQVKSMDAVICRIARELFEPEKIHLLVEERKLHAALQRAKFGMPSQNTSGVAAPRTELEQALAAAWRSVLYVEPIGIHDNFFDLGGTSLMMPQVIICLHKKTGREVSLVDMFEYPTIASLAEHIQKLDQPAEAFQNMYQRVKKQKEILRQQRQWAMHKEEKTV